MLLSELLDLYCETRFLRDASITTYKYSLNAFLIRVPECASMSIEDITTKHIVKFRQALREKGRTSETWNTYRTHLHMLLKFAQTQGYIATNPVKIVGTAPVQHGNHRMISTQDVSSLVQYLDKSTAPLAPLWAVITRTFYYTGMRRAQLLALRWRDVCLDTNTITLSVESSKNHRQWQIPICDDLASHLRDLLRTAQSIRSSSLDDKVFDTTIFGETRQLEKTMLSRKYVELGKKLNIKVSPHRFRHSLASQLANSDTNLRLVQQLLGHTNISTTCRYIHPNIEALRTTMTKVTSLSV